MVHMDNLLNKIDISINRAVVRSIDIQYGEENALPRISIILDLLSVGGKKVTSVSLDTDGWNDDTRLDKNGLDPKIWLYCKGILEQIAPSCVRKINSIDALLEA